MINKSAFKRALCLTVLLAFSWTSVAFPISKEIVVPQVSVEKGIQEVNRESVKEDLPKGLKDVLNPRLIKIPEELGEIMEVYDPLQPGVDAGTISEDKRSETRLVIHIRDAHANYEAQVNIKKLLDYLVRVYGFNLIQVEGATSHVDPSIFELSMFKEGNQKIADYLMRQGKLTAAEAFAIETDQPVDVYGIEDEDLYRANLKAFRDVFSYQEDIKNYGTTAGNILSKLVGSSLNEPLQELFRVVSDYEGKKLDLLEYVETLNQLAKERNIFTLNDFSEVLRFPNLIRLLRLKQIESDLDQAALLREKNRLISEFESKVPQSEERDYIIEELRSDLKGVSSARGFFGGLEKLAIANGIDMTWYYQFKLYAEHAVLREEVNGRAVFSEIDELKKVLEEAFLKTDTEKQIVDIIKDYIVLKKFFRLELSRENLLYYKEHHEEINLKNFTANLIKLAKEHNIATDGLEITPRLETCFDKMNFFYRVALERDNIFIMNALKRMADLKAKKTILITGGFHSEGIAQNLADLGVSYISISPRFKFEEEEDNYLNVMLESPSPYGTVFAGTFSLARFVLADQAMRNANIEEACRELMEIVAMEPWATLTMHQALVNQGLLEQKYPAVFAAMSKLPASEQKTYMVNALNDVFRSAFEKGLIPFLPQVVNVIGYPPSVREATIAVSYRRGDDKIVATVPVTYNEQGVPQLGVFTPQVQSFSRDERTKFPDLAAIFKASKVSPPGLPAIATAMMKPNATQPYFAAFGITPTAVPPELYNVALSQFYQRALRIVASRYVPNTPAFFRDVSIVVPPEQKPVMVRALAEALLSQMPQDVDITTFVAARVPPEYVQSVTAAIQGQVSVSAAVPVAPNVPTALVYSKVAELAPQVPENLRPVIYPALVVPLVPGFQKVQGVNLPAQIPNLRDLVEPFLVSNVQIPNLAERPEILNPLVTALVNKVSQPYAAPQPLPQLPPEVSNSLVLPSVLKDVIVSLSELPEEFRGPALAELAKVPITGLYESLYMPVIPVTPEAVQELVSMPRIERFLETELGLSPETVGTLPVLPATIQVELIRDIVEPLAGVYAKSLYDLTNPDLPEVIPPPTSVIPHTPEAPKEVLDIAALRGGTQVLGETTYSDAFLAKSPAEVIEKLPSGEELRRLLVVLEDTRKERGWVTTQEVGEIIKAQVPAVVAVDASAMQRAVAGEKTTVANVVKFLLTTEQGLSVTVGLSDPRGAFSLKDPFVRDLIKLEMKYMNPESAFGFVHVVGHKIDSVEAENIAESVTKSLRGYMDIPDFDVRFKVIVVGTTDEAPAAFSELIQGVSFKELRKKYTVFKGNIAAFRQIVAVVLPKDMLEAVKTKVHGVIPVESLDREPDIVMAKDNIREGAGIVQYFIGPKLSWRMMNEKQINAATLLEQVGDANIIIIPQRSGDNFRLNTAGIVAIAAELGRSLGAAMRFARAA
ncbi:MAG: hypothetical protein PHE61_04575 [Candidatus Omnitrophica bacterium]|nr:hypothetical protein [Candidatus Omnitrophota bacterium]